MTESLSLAERARIRLFYRCPICRWPRYITDTPNWEREYITHPRHGFVSQLTAAQDDVSQHSCADYMTAVSRSPRAQALNRGESVPEYGPVKRKRSEPAYITEQDKLGRFTGKRVPVQSVREAESA